MAEIEKLNKTFQREQVLASDEMNAVTKKIDEVIQEVNSPTNAPKGGYNRALFEAAGAVYNEETGFYELNGLTDITEEEMYDIYTYNNMLNIGDLIQLYCNPYTKTRTNIPPKTAKDFGSIRYTEISYTSYANNII